MNSKAAKSSRVLTLYLVLAYGLSWLVWLPLVLSQSGAGLIHSTVPIFPWVALGTFGPVAAALSAQRICYGNLKEFRLWTSWPQMLTGSAAGVLVLLAARWLLSAIGLSRSGFSGWNWAALLHTGSYFLPNLVGGPIGEEPGWRGFALPHLQSAYGPVMASVLLGLLWAGWHLPLFLIHGWTTAPIWVFTTTMASLSLIMSFGFNVSGGSVLVAILMHDVFNCAGGPLYEMLATSTLRKNPDLVVSCAFVTTAVLLIATSRGRLGLTRKAGSETDCDAPREPGG